MKQFAFILHPLNVELVSVAFNEPSLLKKRYSLIKKAFEWVKPFKCSEVTGVKSITGDTLKGHLIYFALLPEQIMALDEKLIVNRIISAGKIAEDIGVDILGVGAYIAQVGKKGLTFTKSLKVPVTTGTHYTIYIAIESVLFAAEKIGIEISESIVAIVGATGAIGRTCAEFFAEKAKKIILVAQNENRLEQLKSNLCEATKAEVVVKKNIKEAIGEADITIMATTSLIPLIEVNDLRKGTIVCDVSRPRNISPRGIEKKYDEVIVIDGGLVQPPGEDVNFNFFFGLSPGVTYACMAEAMILALEGRHENYSLGGKISINKVKEIAFLGKKHGFSLSKIRSFDKEISSKVFDNVRKIREGVTL